MKQLFERFIEEEAYQEYTIRLIKISLALFFTSCKNKKGKKSETGLNENEIINAQKRALIIELLKLIINLQCISLNEQIKPLVVHVYLQL